MTEPQPRRRREAPGGPGRIARRVAALRTAWSPAGSNPEQLSQCVVALGDQPLTVEVVGLTELAAVMSRHQCSGGHPPSVVTSGQPSSVPLETPGPAFQVGELAGRLDVRPERLVRVFQFSGGFAPRLGTPGPSLRQGFTDLQIRQDLCVLHLIAQQLVTVDGCRAVGGVPTTALQKICQRGGVPGQRHLRGELASIQGVQLLGDRKRTLASLEWDAGAPPGVQLAGRARLTCVAAIDRLAPFMPLGLSRERG